MRTGTGRCIHHEASAPQSSSKCPQTLCKVSAASGPRPMFAHVPAPVKTPVPSEMLRSQDGPCTVTWHASLVLVAQSCSPNIQRILSCTSPCICLPSTSIHSCVIAVSGQRVKMHARRGVRSVYWPRGSFFQPLTAPPERFAVGCRMTLSALGNSRNLYKISFESGHGELCLGSNCSSRSDRVNRKPGHRSVIRVADVICVPRAARDGGQNTQYVQQRW